MDALGMLEATLPADLVQQAHNPAIIQEAIDRLDAFQSNARAWLFKALAAQAQGASPQQLADVLGQLADNASYLLPDTPEAQLVPHVQHFRDLTAQVAALEKQLAMEQEAAGVHAQLAEFDAFISKGNYGEAAWAAIRMRETLKAEHEQRQQQQQGQQEEQEQHHEGHMSERALQDLQESYERCEARMSQVLAEESALVLQLDVAARQLRVRSALPPCGVPVSELWAALQARGQLQAQLNAMAGQKQGPQA